MHMTTIVFAIFGILSINSTSVTKLHDRFVYVGPVTVS